VVSGSGIYSCAATLASTTQETVGWVIARDPRVTSPPHSVPRARGGIGCARCLPESLAANVAQYHRSAVAGPLPSATGAAFLPREELGELPPVLAVAGTSRWEHCRAGVKAFPTPRRNERGGPSILP